MAQASKGGKIRHNREHCRSGHPYKEVPMQSRKIFSIVVVAAMLFPIGLTSITWAQDQDRLKTQDKLKDPDLDRDRLKTQDKLKDPDQDRLHTKDQDRISRPERPERPHMEKPERPERPERAERGMGR